MATPYEHVVKDLSLSVSSQSDEAWLYLICKLGASLDSDPTSGNVYRDLLSRLETAAGDCFAVKRLKYMLNAHVEKIDNGKIR